MSSLHLGIAGGGVADSRDAQEAARGSWCKTLVRG